VAAAEQQLAKLTIEAYTDQEFSERTGEPWHALFNPTELSFSRKNAYNNEPSAGTSQPQTSYANGEPDEITLDLFFDGTGVVESDTTVRARIDALLALAAFQPDTHQPYYLHVFWGSWNFLGVMTSAKVTYKIFDREGEPLRATVSATLQEVVAPEVLARTERRESPDLHQTWLVRDGETLDAIAHKVYGSADFWRPLAEVNCLANPRSLDAGRLLLLPPKAR
jgi:hypothetical protein